MNETIKPDELKKAIANNNALTILDVRRRADLDADKQMIAGAVYRDPEQVDQWSESLAEGQNVVVYCARGGSVGLSVSEKLNQKNINARFIEGGIKAWKESGGEVQEKSSQ